MNSLWPNDTIYGVIDLGQHWFRWWLVAWWCQAITWTNVDWSSLSSRDIHLQAISYDIKIGSTRFHLKFPSRSTTGRWDNSLASGRSKCDFKNVIFNLALLIGIFKSSYDNVLRWMPRDLTDDKSTLVQVMAWCCHATSHYLNQCWPRSPTPYGVTRPQWVN